MRRIIVLLVLATSVIFTLGATAAPASAANCTAFHSYIYYSAGWLEFGSKAINCVGVDKVQFNRVVTVEGCAGATPSVVNYCATGIYDGTEHDSLGLSGNHTAPDFANIPTATQPVIAGNQQTDYVLWRVSPWCSGATHWVATQFQWRIHQYLGNWGPWHYSRSPGYPIVC